MFSKNRVYFEENVVFFLSEFMELWNVLRRHYFLEVNDESFFDYFSSLYKILGFLIWLKV